MVSLELGKPIGVHLEQGVNVYILRIEVVRRVLLDLLHDALDCHVPLGHVGRQNKSQELGARALLRLLHHVCEAFLGILELPSVFRDQTVTMKEPFLGEDVILGYFKLVHSAIVKAHRWASVTRTALTNVALIGLQEARQTRILLCTLPMIDKVLQGGKEFNDSFFNLWPNFVFVSEEKNQVLVHSQVSRIDGSINLRSVQNPMVIDFIYGLLEICPGWQTQFEFLLRTLQACRAWGNWRDTAI